MGRSYAALLFVLVVCVAWSETFPTDVLGAATTASMADGNGDATAEYTGSEQASTPAACSHGGPHANQERIRYNQQVIINPPAPISSEVCDISAIQGLIEEALHKSQKDSERNLKQALTAVTNRSVTSLEMARFQEETNRQLDQLSTAVSHQEAVIERLSTAVSDLADTLKNTSDQVILPRDCSDILAKGVSISGVYTVQPRDDGGPVEVYCDMETDGGGWTVFQRRHNGSVDFLRGWQSYRQGFGDLDGEFWLGNDDLHQLTAHCDYKLRIDLADFEGNSAFAVYDTFRVADGCEDNYKLTVGGYSGTAGDSMAYHNDKPLTTKDRDNDDWDRNCAEGFHGAWWYGACVYSNLNGAYLGGPTDRRWEGMVWYHWKTENYSLKSSAMKIKRIH